MSHRPLLLALHPGFVTARFYESWDFYTEVLLFRTVAEGNGRVHLRHPDGPELCIQQEETDDQPAELVSATDGRGFWFTLEVADVDQEYARLRVRGDIVRSELERDVWGTRHFVVRDPNGIRICIRERTTTGVPEHALSTVSS